LLLATGKNIHSKKTSSSQYVWRFSSIFDPHGNPCHTTVHENLIGSFFQHSNHPLATRSNDFCTIRMVQKLRAGSKTRGGLLGLSTSGGRRAADTRTQRSVFFSLAGRAARQEEGEQSREEGEQLAHTFNV
jgi:hypothetical protein